MSEQDTKPTPAVGMPAVVAATSIAKASGEDQSASEKGVATALILSAIDDLGKELRTEVGALRDESRARHRELAAADDTTKHELRRLERRVEEVEQQLRDDRAARDRENDARLAEQRARDQAKQELTDALDGFKRHAEQVTRATTEREEAAVRRYEEAAQKMEATVASVGALTDRVSAVETAREEDRVAQAERDRQQDDRFARIADELGLEPTPDGKTPDGNAIVPAGGKALAPPMPSGRIRALTRQQKIGALLIIAANLSTALVYWLSHR